MWSWESSYGERYRALQQAQQQAFWQAAYGGPRFWETPEYRAMGNLQEKEATRFRVPVVKEYEKVGTDPFVDLSNHQFHALLDKFQTMKE